MGIQLSWRSVRVWRPCVSGRIHYGVWRLYQPIGRPTPLRRFWCDIWTPTWHEGRGPYVSIGLGLFAVGRGY